MASYIGVYLHGFLSSGNSLKGQWLQHKVSKNQAANKTSILVELLTPTYPIKSPKVSADLIDSVIQTQLLNSKQTGHEIVLIGSSMGGFYAQFFAHKYQLPYVLINPALNPLPLLEKHFGEHLNPNTNESVTIDRNYLMQLAEFEIEYDRVRSPMLLLLDKDDEVVDVDHITKDFQTSISAQPILQKSVIYSGGDHSFVHMDDAWTQINDFLDLIEADKAFN